MDEPHPFIEEERREIRNIARVVFWGGDPDCDTELAPLNKKWGPVFKLFLHCVDRRYGNYLHFPAAGGALDQPHRLMQVFDVMRDIFTEKIREDEKRKWQA